MLYQYVDVVTISTSISLFFISFLSRAFYVDIRLERLCENSLVFFFQLNQIIVTIISRIESKAKLSLPLHFQYGINVGMEILKAS